jgi:phosphomannomutase
MAVEGALRYQVRNWMAHDPDPATVAEAQALLDAGDEAALRDRFGARLQFGTAGLRGALGAGPNRMNRLIIRQAAAGLADYLLATDPTARERGVVIGYDARHGSHDFAHDTALVLAARGIRSMMLPPRQPTPLLAWSIRALGAAAGVMVTASHNPPQDNGYKVYLSDGAQIVPPHDVGISRCIDAVGLDVAVGDSGSRLIERVDESIIDRYLDAAVKVRLTPAVPGVTVVATALHGVGGTLLRRAFLRAGFAVPECVGTQQNPNPDFPTVAFPNPEEPGAMDAVMALGAARHAALAIANDPDADRLGAAIPLRAGGWRRLGGDEIGWLLADHILQHTSGDDRLVVTTLVSSSLLARMATAHGVHHRETFTGFKWIGRTVLDNPTLRFVFGYEQALGYLVAQQPLDKDGITAAIMLAEVAACAAADGVTLEDRLDAIRATYGNLVTAERSIRMSPDMAAARVAALTKSPPSEVGGLAVTGVEEYPEAGLLRLWCGSVRLQVRPSGTEPKVKLYAEAEDADPAPYLDALAALLAHETRG